MRHLNNFKKFNEGSISKIVAGAMIAASSLLPRTAMANEDDSVKVKSNRTEIVVSKEGNDVAKFNIFLFNKNGEMIRQTIEGTQLPTQNIANGEYQLNVIDENQKKYMFRVKIENF